MRPRANSIPGSGLGRLKGWASIASGFAGYMQVTQQQHRIALIHLFRGVAKFIAVVTVVLVILSLGGVNLTAAIAGIGIGGVALAFAAQKTLENVFGTVMLVTDQPIRVGDLCRMGDTVGVIEDIGMRSTRVRTAERTIVTVPNGQASSMIVENFATRDKISFKHVIGLRYETTPDQLRQVLAGVRKLLGACATPGGFRACPPGEVRRLLARPRSQRLCSRDRSRHLPENPGGAAPADHGRGRGRRDDAGISKPDDVCVRGGRQERRGARRGPAIPA